MVGKNLRKPSFSGDSVTAANSDSSYSSYSSHCSASAFRSSPSASNSPAGLQTMDHHHAWWSGYVPLASWIPPDISDIPRFQGMIGLDLISGSNDMNSTFMENLMKSQACLPQSLAEQFLFELSKGSCKPGMTRGDRFGSSPSAQALEEGSSKNSTHQDDTIGSPATDPYGCGWEEDPPNLHTAMPLLTQEDPYGLGWEDATFIEPPTIASALEDGLHGCKSDDIDEDDPYDCRWQDGIDLEAMALTVTPVGDEEEDMYDCGWDDGMDVGQGTVALPSDATSEDPYDCGWDAPMDVDIADHWDVEIHPNDHRSMPSDRHSDSVLSSQDSSNGSKEGLCHLCSVESILAPAGWNLPSKTISHIKKEPDDETMTNRNLGFIDLTLPSPPTSCGAFIDLTSPTSSNNHIQEIVMPNVAPMNNPSPAAIFMVNWRLFGVYADASNQVTELGEDVVAIY
ncbi:hypothetical protein BDR05DRAFT_949543 [Suillus weaverae]|nr:hypothetical protein BDR05DRAFT_949543 [Suillus weaverae]